MSELIRPHESFLNESSLVGERTEVESNGVSAFTGRSQVAAVLLEVVHRAAQVDGPLVVGTELELAGAEGNLAGPNQVVGRGSESCRSTPAIGSGVADEADGLDQWPRR